MKLKKVGLFSHFRIHFPTWQPWLILIHFLPENMPQNIPKLASSKHPLTPAVVNHHHFRHKLLSLGPHPFQTSNPGSPFNNGGRSRVGSENSVTSGWPQPRPRMQSEVRRDLCSNQLRVIYHTCIITSVHILIIY